MLEEHNNQRFGKPNLTCQKIWALEELIVLLQKTETTSVKLRLKTVKQT